ncbi:hypothetical protein MJO28_008196, partial [Puccinia striiformis f. sp. tritici]
MRAGDIGRVINMWNRWAVMANGMTGLRNYAIHLPRMVLLLTKVLPEGLATVLRHPLLVCPSGRPNHFVGKDFYLENQNFWLKYFYNHSGIGTEINRLKEVFSLNISISCCSSLMLFSCVNWCRASRGTQNLVVQSHKHELTSDSINNFLKMAQQHEILSDKTTQKTQIKDVYTDGRDALQEDFKKKAASLTGCDRQQLSSTALQLDRLKMKCQLMMTKKTVAWKLMSN